MKQNKLTAVPTSFRGLFVLHEHPALSAAYNDADVENV